MYNFNEIPVNDNQGGFERQPRKTVSPSIGIFTIEEASVKENVNKKEFLSVKFVNEAGQYFTQQFYLTPKALVRIKDLADPMGINLGEETNDTLPAKLVGKKVGLIVDGVTTLENIEGRDVKVTRANLRFRGFTYDPNKEAPFKEADIRYEDKTAPVAQVTAGIEDDNSDDLPF